MSAPLVAANWKMHGTLAQSVRRAEDIANWHRRHRALDVLLFPPVLHLVEVVRVQGTLQCGAQNLHWLAQGAETGEISPEMVWDAGGRSVILGHSERRKAGETDAQVALKVRAALRVGLRPVVCVGETLREREAGVADSVVKVQLDTALGGLAEQVLGCDVAYEPVWAIGTGRTASVEQAATMHRHIRRCLSELWAGSERTRVVYGGSVKASNASELFADRDIDGALVGGASLDVLEFLNICEAMVQARGLD